MLILYRQKRRTLTQVLSIPAPVITKYVRPTSLRGKF